VPRRKNSGESYTPMKLHPLTLSFAGDQAVLEPRFLESRRSWYIRFLQQALILGMAFYALFALLDLVMAPEVKNRLWFIRFVLVEPLLLGTLHISRISRFRTWSQGLVVFALLTAGSGISAMIALLEPPASYAYYAGILLVLMLGYGYSRCRFLWASLAGWMNFFVYLVIAVWIVRTPGYSRLDRPDASVSPDE